MRFATALSALASLAAASGAQAQTALNLKALQGLAPFSIMLNNDAGKAALTANYTITGAIQTGTANQPALQPFAAQQAQALRDAFITSGNATELADGLGTTLGSAYHKLASYTPGTPKPSFTNISPALANLFAYSYKLTSADANAGKYVFANGTYETDKTPSAPASPAALAILKTIGGTTDVFGKAYTLPAGANGADPDGDSRPYMTEKNLILYTDPDYFGAASGNKAYLYGPAQDLEKSPSFPSGHTTYGYTESTLLAIMVPARYTQEITRGAEYGNSRIVLGAHYAMDVIAGRTLAWYDLAQLLSENPAYLNQKEGKAQPIGNYAAALGAARLSLVLALQSTAGESVAKAASADSGRFASQAADEAFYESTQTYGLPVVYKAEAAKPENVAKLAPEAGYLLTAAFPKLTLKQADKILTATQGPGGGFLDNGSRFGVYSRIDLYKAGLQAAALEAK